MAHAWVNRCERGDLVCEVNDPFDHLCLVIEGVIEIRTVMLGRRHLMTFLAAGELTGVLCCIDGKGQLHDLIAHSDVVLMYVPGDLIRRRRFIDPALSVALELQLAYRSRRLYELLAGASLLSLRARLARLLVQLESGFGIHRGAADIISLRLSQTDIADLLGTSRQWANRELNELEKLGMIRVKRSSVEILDLKALAEVGSPG
ncbi:cAMP-binding domain of CRP or a regulatory subunit of cAMP-dependent protein kinases [Polaromonas sp. OV174]|nr:cAMP-binding domain of CRP or a regulatory subunit of cAMP-dependent protein kinases [Polaromonas sp. OV174]